MISLSITDTTLPFPYSYGSEVHLNTGTEFARFGFNGSTTISGLVGVDDFDGDGLTDLLIGGGKILAGQGRVRTYFAAMIPPGTDAPRPGSRFCVASFSRPAHWNDNCPFVYDATDPYGRKPGTSCFRTIWQTGGAVA